MHSLITDLIITNEEAKLLDQNASEINMIPPEILMEEAASVIFHQLLLDFPGLSTEIITILAGWGNNGGDALALARKLYFAHKMVKVFIFPAKNGSHLYHLQLNILKTLDIPIYNIENLQEQSEGSTLFIDGIFGIGYKYRKNAFMEKIFNFLGETNIPVLSIDIPSGLTCENHISVKADYTYSVGFLKKIFFNINTRRKAGHIRNLPISFDTRHLKKELKPKYINRVPSYTRQNNNFVHKYSRGGVICIGGSPGKYGSVIYSAESALKSGAGISLVISNKKNISILNTLSMLPVYDSFDSLANYIKHYRTILIGPGLDILPDDVLKLKDHFQKDRQFILDASFFSCFSEKDLHLFNKPPVLTPHTGEFCRFFWNPIR